MSSTSSRPALQTPEARRSRSSVRTAEKEKKEAGFEQRLQEWSLRHQVSKQKQLQARQEKELKELDECTFQPSINAKSEFYARRARGCFIEPLQSRLFHEADKRRSLRDKAKKLVEADQMCDFTFQPQINRTSSGSKETKPIHLRTDVIRQQKEEKVRSAQMVEDKRSECYFQPKISDKSERLVQRRRDRLYRAACQGQADCLKQLGPVEDRLYAEAMEKEQRRSVLQDCIEESIPAQPSVDETSRRICKTSVYFQGAQQDFLTRQQTFELARQRRREVRMQHADSECSFRPAITETSRQMIASNVELLGETSDERVQRLAVQDVVRRDQMREELGQLHHREYTFKPEINAVSAMLAAARTEDSAAGLGLDGDDSAHERLYRAGLAKSRLSEDSRFDDYSFRPRLDPRSVKRYAHVQPRYAQDADLMETIRQEMEQKAEHILERRREQEEKQRADCTFAPSVGASYKEPQQPVVVSGLGRFFELKSLALKKQQEQEEREAKVFRPEKEGMRVAGVTIAEPFQLSSGTTRPQPEEDSQWLERHEECTFAPQTNETKNRDIIRDIIGTVEVH